MALVVQISNLAIFTVRVFIPEGYVDEETNQEPLIFVIIPLCNTVMWLVLGYIVYELSFIRVKIESDTLETYKVKS